AAVDKSGITDGDTIINSCLLVKKRFFGLVDMHSRKSCVQVGSRIGKISIVHTNLHVYIINVTVIKLGSYGSLVGIKELPVPLTGKTKVGRINIFIGPSHIKPKTYEASCVDHLVIGYRSIYFSRGEHTCSRHIPQYNSAQAKPPGVLIILHKLKIPKCTHCFIWKGSDRCPLIAVVNT